MEILALDLATKTGWAVDPLTGGVWDLTPERGSSPGMRFLRLRGLLNGIRIGHPFGLVVYERPHYRGGHATEVLAGLVAVVQEWCAEQGIDHMAVPSGTLKKYATGNGRATKADMVAAAEARGWRPVDDNHADALWLLEYARDTVGVDA